jgi:hypothetical protein
MGQEGEGKMLITVMQQKRFKDHVTRMNEMETGDRK